MNILNSHFIIDACPYLLVFDNNIFTYEKRFYRQIHGIAMGSKCGPSVANIDISILEESFLIIHKPLLYVRFIDDIFTIVKKSFDIQILIATFTYLKLNIVTSKKVVFLDLIIKLCDSTGTLSFSLYTKPTCTLSYLLSESNHPSFIFKKIPKSLLIRIKRIDSEHSDFLHDGIRLIDQLVARGYDISLVFKMFVIVSRIDRNSVIPYKKKENIQHQAQVNNTLFFKLPFDKSVKQDSLALAFNTASNQLRSTVIFKDTNVRIVNNMQFNFASLFVHKKQLELYKRLYYTKCFSKNCIICKYSNTNIYLRLFEFFLPCLRNVSCKSVSAIYIIICSSCNAFYIGQTENLYRRISTHIRCCKLNLVSESSVSSKLIKHFNNDVLCSFQNFSFFVFRDNIANKFARLNLETQLIHLFIDLGMKVLNDLIPDRYYWYTNAKLFEITN